MSGAYFAKAWDLRLITLIGEQVGTASTPRLPPEHPRGSPEYPRLRGNPQSASGAPEEYREYPFNPPYLPLQLQGPLRTPALPLQCGGDAHSAQGGVALLCMRLTVCVCSRCCRRSKGRCWRTARRSRTSSCCCTTSTTTASRASRPSLLFHSHLLNLFPLKPSTADADSR